MKKFETKADDKKPVSVHDQMEGAKTNSSFYLGLIKTIIILILVDLLLVFLLPAEPLPDWFSFGNASGIPSWVWVMIGIFIVGIIAWKLFSKYLKGFWKSLLGIGIAICIILVAMNSIDVSSWHFDCFSAKRSGSITPALAVVQQAAYVAPATPVYPHLEASPEGNILEVKARIVYRFTRLAETFYYFNCKNDNPVLTFTYEANPSRWYKGIAGTDFGLLEGVDPMLPGEYLITSDRDATIVVRSLHK